MKFHIKTYGCQMNERDSELAGALLLKHGFEQASDEDGADIVIVNTCSVRGKAEDKAIGKLGFLAAGKRERPGRIIGAIGCVVQQMEGEILRRVPGLDFAVGTRRIGRLPEVVASVLNGRAPIVDTGGDTARDEDQSLHIRGPVSAFVNILYGCNRKCTYCVVPAVRGAEWSRPAESILDELRELARAGVSEVTLLGQSVMSYGLANNVWPESYRSPRGFMEPLPRLLEAANDLGGIKRIRFTSGHPSGCTAELAAAMAGLPAVCEHLHLPLQSGSDRILKMMKRGYSSDDYRQAVHRLREGMPGMAITTDIIVGFPSETERDFEMTAQFMDEIGFDNAFIFKYSPRPETAAAALKDDVPAAEKMRRNKALLAQQDKRGIGINRKLVGSEVEVLVEGTSLRNKTRLAGRTRTNKIAVFEGRKGNKAGDMVSVNIRRAAAQTLYGEIDE
jgi:tRNA-2-methylthio-N6-dimethylallyladenosine synthase